MDQLNPLFARLEATFGLQAPQLKIAFKITLTLIIFCIVWLILRQILSFIEKRIRKVNLLKFRNRSLELFERRLCWPWCC